MRKKRVNIQAANDNFSISENKKKVNEVARSLSCLLGKRVAKEYWSYMNSANDNKEIENNGVCASRKQEEEK